MFYNVTVVVKIYFWPKIIQTNINDFYFPLFQIAHCNEYEKPTALKNFIKAENIC